MKKPKMKDGLYRMCAHCETLFPILNIDAKEQLCWPCYRKVMWSSYIGKFHLTAPAYKPPIFPCLDLWDNLVLGPCKYPGAEPPMILAENSLVSQDTALKKETKTKKTKKKVYHKICSEIGCLNEFVIKNNRQTRCESCSKELVRQKRLQKALEKKLAQTTMPIET